MSLQPDVYIDVTPDSSSDYAFYAYVDGRPCVLYVCIDTHDFHVREIGSSVSNILVYNVKGLAVHQPDISSPPEIYLLRLDGSIWYGVVDKLDGMTTDIQQLNVSLPSPGENSRVRHISICKTVQKMKDYYLLMVEDDVKHWAFVSRNTKFTSNVQRIQMYNNRLDPEFDVTLGRIQVFPDTEDLITVGVDRYTKATGQHDVGIYIVKHKFS